MASRSYFEEFQQCSFYLHKEQFKQLKNIARLRGIPKTVLYREMAAMIIKKYEHLVITDAQKTLLRKS